MSLSRRHKTQDFFHLIISLRIFRISNFGLCWRRYLVSAFGHPPRVPKRCSKINWRQNLGVPIFWAPKTFGFSEIDDVSHHEPISSFNLKSWQHQRWRNSMENFHKVDRTNEASSIRNFKKCPSILGLMLKISRSIKGKSLLLNAKF